MARLTARLGMTRYEADEYYRIALDSFQKKKLEEAINNINSAIDMYPRRAEYYAVRGYFRLQDGTPTEAGADFDQSLAINPYEILANFGKGVIAYNDKEYDEALTYFTNAWAAQPDRAETLYYLGLTFHRQRDNVQAKYYMSQAADIYEKLAENDREARKRMRNADKWMSEFDKLIAEQLKREDVLQPSADDASN
ncbi:MAG: tetratricopeptide repeat protein [Chloroflexota bacterium]